MRGQLVGVGLLEIGPLGFIDLTGLGDRVVAGLGRPGLRLGKRLPRIGNLCLLGGEGPLLAALIRKEQRFPDACAGNDVVIEGQGVGLLGLVVLGLADHGTAFLGGADPCVERRLGLEVCIPGCTKPDGQRLDGCHNLEVERTLIIAGDRIVVLDRLSDRLPGGVPCRVHDARIGLIGTGHARLERGLGGSQVGDVLRGPCLLVGVVAVLRRRGVRVVRVIGRFEGDVQRVPSCGHGRSIGVVGALDGRVVGCLVSGNGRVVGSLGGLVGRAGRRRVRGNLRIQGGLVRDQGRIVDAGGCLHRRVVSCFRGGDCRVVGRQVAVHGRIEHSRGRRQAGFKRGRANDRAEVESRAACQ